MIPLAGWRATGVSRLIRGLTPPARQPALFRGGTQLEFRL